MRKVVLELNNEREKTPVPIVGDGLIVQRGVADGRAVPVLIVDTTNRSDIDVLVKAHETLGPGDARTMWLPRRWPRNGLLQLIVEFQRPQRCVVLIEFDVVRHGSLVDTIIQNELVCVLPGRPGDQVSSSIDKPRVIVEAPSGHFRPAWDRLMRRHVAKSLRKRGVPRREIESGVDALIQEWRYLWAMRMRNESHEP